MEAGLAFEWDVASGGGWDVVSVVLWEAGWAFG